MQPIVCFTAHNQHENAICIQNSKDQRIFVPKERTINAIIPSISLTHTTIKKGAWRCYHTDLPMDTIKPSNGYHAHIHKVPYMYIFQDEETKALCYSHDGCSIIKLNDPQTQDPMLLDAIFYFKDNKVTIKSYHKLKKPFLKQDDGCRIL
ncbi:MAG: hypothetical protein WC222_04495 [Parachlamydiales bacterium]